MQETSLGCDDKASSFQSSIAHFPVISCRERTLPKDLTFRSRPLSPHTSTHAHKHTHTHICTRARTETQDTRTLLIPLSSSLFLRFESKSKMTHIAIRFNSDQSGVDIVVLSAGRLSLHPRGISVLLSSFSRETSPANDAQSLLL